MRFLPMTLTIIVTAPLAGRYASRHGSRAPMTYGLLLAGGGLLLLGLTLQADTPYRYLLPVFVVMGHGMGATMAPMTAAVMNAVGPQRAGLGSAMTNTSREVGGVFGIALLGTVLTTKLKTSFVPADRRAWGSAPSRRARSRPRPVTARIDAVAARGPVPRPGRRRAGERSRARSWTGSTSRSSIGGLGAAAWPRSSRTGSSRAASTVAEVHADERRRGGRALSGGSVSAPGLNTIIAITKMISTARSIREIEKSRLMRACTSGSPAPRSASACRPCPASGPMNNAPNSAVLRMPRSPSRIQVSVHSMDGAYQTIAMPDHERPPPTPGWRHHVPELLDVLGERGEPVVLAGAAQPRGVDLDEDPPPTQTIAARMWTDFSVS